ncbi:putative RDD family membrane protein YckC [Flavobacterium sp. CG_9.1]|uniref:RDD family protein n=1 Tax=Flavobacterium sp. CG_9.1 TaxID=2787728 RepID=UPI0018CA7876|nr:RDD family protein [Flavobacterium sp. CG_9.1]MBG6060292.1 putative RDD family membrane protein YckC [Flavobacterium sp. CG_9.1]
METKEFTITDDLLASKGQRFLNFIIDLLVVYMFTVGIGAAVNIIGELTENYSLAEWIISLTLIENILFMLVVLFFYYLIMELYFSRTFGKYFTKTMVVKHNGSKPNVKSIVIRTLVRMVLIEAFSFLSDNARGWHDTLSVTYVVNKHEFISKMKL